MTRRHSLGAPARRPRQSGAALLVAMVLVTVVTTLAAGMVWQQWRAVEVEAAERARTQSAWILNGALDWARLILREDARTSKVDHLGEPWSVPLAEARLSTFLAAERSTNADDGPEAFLSGDITDAQSRFNLRNLVTQATTSLGSGTTTSTPFVPDKDQVAVLQRLLGTALVSPTLALQIASQLALVLNNDPQALLWPQSFDQLGWLGLDEAARAKLAPWVTLLPQPTKVNVNTAPREVLAAVIPTNGMGAAQVLVQQREHRPYEQSTLGTAVSQALGPTATPVQTNWLTNALSVESNYFEVRGRLRLGDQVLVERSLVERNGTGPNNLPVLRRERINVTADPAALR
ncbi:type II secretion system minor pseudopilin GspK [Azohydromonas australica]|uniref:type II secretion system minor pseudopilin GspK n=1 Tax=Azohydromonas australica TaxID=364039 RepID=UPI00040CA42A|nr:type II secretion system minor pseudopilin GspK [Azohydromonas australica]